MKYLIIILLFTSIGCDSQEKKILSLTNIFENDTVIYADGYFTEKPIKHWKYHIDSSEWRLYAIKNDTFYYFKLISYGIVNEIGVSNLVGYMDKSYMTANYLLDSSKVSDTIPHPYNFYSEAVNADNPNAEYGHIIIKYYTGGIFGEFIREEHLNDGKKKKKQ